MRDQRFDWSETASRWVMGGEICCDQALIEHEGRCRGRSHGRVGGKNGGCVHTRIGAQSATTRAALSEALRAVHSYQVRVRGRRPWPLRGRGNDDGERARLKRRRRGTKTVAVNIDGVARLPNDKPVVYWIKTEHGTTNYVGIAHVVGSSPRSQGPGRSKTQHPRGESNRETDRRTPEAPHEPAGIAPAICAAFGAGSLQPHGGVSGTGWRLKGLLPSDPGVPQIETASKRCRDSTVA